MKTWPASIAADYRAGNLISIQNSIMSLNESIYRFDPSELAKPRPEGISAFMRIRNGEDFLRLTIESHIEHFDEIVAVHNECTDNSVAILNRLQARHGPKLRILQYEPAVYRLGSRQHREAATDSIHGMANYSNYCLANTRYRVVTKLDDDHIAIEENVANITARIRQDGCKLGNRLLCFSGINLLAAGQKWGAHRLVPFAGSGDHWFFEANGRNYFHQDRRFERFDRRGLGMEYCGLSYWHCKYLKQGFGFSSYELEKNPGSRFHKRWKQFEQNRDPILLDALEEQCRRRAKHPKLISRIKRLLSDKERLRHARDLSLDASALNPKLAMLRAKLAAQNQPQLADNLESLPAATQLS